MNTPAELSGWRLDPQVLEHDPAVGSHDQERRTTDVRHDNFVIDHIHPTTPPTNKTHVVTTTLDATDLGLAPPPDESCISQHAAAMRAYIAACSAHDKRHVETGTYNATNGKRLKSTDQQPQHLLPSPDQTERQKPDRTLRHNVEVGMNTATVQGGVNTANPRDDLTTNTTTEVTDVTDFAYHVA